MTKFKTWQRHDSLRHDDKVALVNIIQGDILSMNEQEIGAFHFLSLQEYRRLLELNLRWFDPSEKMISVKTITVSHPEKGNCVNLSSGKIYRPWDKPLEKALIKRPLAQGFSRPYVCTDKKWNSSLSAKVKLYICIYIYIYIYGIQNQKLYIYIYI